MILQLILEELRQSDPPDAKHVLRELDKLQSSSAANGRVCAAQTMWKAFVILIA